MSRIEKIINCFRIKPLTGNGIVLLDGLNISSLLRSPEANEFISSAAKQKANMINKEYQNLLENGQIYESSLYR